MMSFDIRRTQQLRAVISGLLGTAAFAAAAPPLHAQTLETVTVTAQRRETDLQSTPVAISAYTGEALAENKIFTVNDLASSVPAFSLTALTPLDAELNIRGITNTRLDSPTADPSVGTFVDGVYMGRTGDLNYDFYDIERIEVIRGPQGVLLGKNVVGGALSVITAKPTFEPSGNVLVSYGNYNSRSRAASTTATRRMSCTTATWRIWSPIRRACSSCMAPTVPRFAAAWRSTTTATKPTASTPSPSQAARPSAKRRTCGRIARVHGATCVRTSA
jgi:outer membrane receptor protein involved in Fe transport